VSGPGIGVNYSPSRAATPSVLESDEFEADIDQLRVRGVTVEQGIHQARWGRFVTFDDPDGNGLILQETSESSP
jgi:hypothetical protein